MARPRVVGNGIPTRQTAPFDGSIAVTIYDLMYLATDDVRPLSSYSLGASEVVDQIALARVFAGLAGDTRPAAQTEAQTDFPVLTDVVVQIDVPSATYAHGDMLAISRNGGGDAIEKIKLKKTTNPAAAIAYVLGNYPSAVTSVLCRVISRVWPNVPETGSRIATPAALAAAGSTASDAAAIAAEVSIVSAADGTKGVKLPDSWPGDVREVYNSHATNGLKIYPHSGGDINDGTTDAAYTIEGKSIARFRNLDGTTWAMGPFVANT